MATKEIINRRNVTLDTNEKIIKWNSRKHYLPVVIRSVPEIQIVSYNFKSGKDFLAIFHSRNIITHEAIGKFIQKNECNYFKYIQYCSGRIIQFKN